MSLTVTVTDNETGETATQQVAEHDYLLLVTGECHVSSTQIFRLSGTHLLTLKSRRNTDFGTVNVPADSPEAAAHAASAGPSGQ